MFRKELIILTIILGFFGNSFSQVEPSSIHQVHNSILGNTGLIMNPTARFGADRQLHLSWFHIPEKYGIITENDKSTGEQHVSFSLMFLPFMEASATLIRPYNQWWGIGDRSYKVRFLLLNETKTLPALALGIHDPVASNTRQGAVYIVGSKEFILKKGWSLDSHLGYAFDLKNEIWEKSKLFQDDSQNNQTHLTGIFGGVSISYEQYSFLVEYDTEKVNAGVSVFIWKYFYAQVTTLGFDAISFGLSARWLFGNKMIWKNDKNY